MSDSNSCEFELRKLVSELYSQAADLEKAADTLRDLRSEDDVNDMKQRIKSAKEWAKSWMNP